MEATAKKPSRIEIINNERRILKKLLIDLFCTNNDAEYRKQFRLQIGRKMTMQPLHRPYRLPILPKPSSLPNTKACFPSRGPPTPRFAAPDLHYSTPSVEILGDFWEIDV